jgi:hypothetical protein
MQRRQLRGWLMVSPRGRPDKRKEAVSDYVSGSFNAVYSGRVGRLGSRCGPARSQHLAVPRAPRAPDLRQLRLDPKAAGPDDVQDGGSQQLTASITKDAVDDLGLQVGQPVTALVRSTEVMIAVA